MDELNRRGKRYVKRKRGERLYNMHVREMVEMLKHEEVKTNLYIKGVKLSKHAHQRYCEVIQEANVVKATRDVKEILSKATRLGSMLSYDGRINVLYAYNQVAIYLTPDLKTVATVNVYKEIRYQPILKKMSKESCKYTKSDIIDLHLHHMENIKKQEERQLKKVLEVESKVSEVRDMYSSMIEAVGRKRCARRGLKSMISEQNHTLKLEAWKLFDIKVRKRHICKSLVSLL